MGSVYSDLVLCFEVFVLSYSAAEGGFWGSRRSRGRTVRSPLASEIAASGASKLQEYYSTHSYREVQFLKHRILLPLNVSVSSSGNSISLARGAKLNFVDFSLIFQDGGLADLYRVKFYL